ncbi:unnamed protein product [Urochloa humidicola]
MILGTLEGEVKEILQPLVNLYETFLPFSACINYAPYVCVQIEYKKRLFFLQAASSVRWSAGTAALPSGRIPHFLYTWKSVPLSRDACLASGS